MHSVDCFIRVKSNIPNFKLIFFEEFQDEPAGFNLRLFTYPENVPLIDFHEFRYLITDKCVGEITELIESEHSCDRFSGKVARITIPIRTPNDPVIACLAELIKTNDVIVSTIQTCEDITIVKDVLKGCKVNYLHFSHMDHFNDAICDEIIAIVSAQEVLSLYINAEYASFTVQDPTRFQAMMAQLDAVFLLMPGTGEFMGISNDYWENILRKKIKAGCTVHINDDIKFDENT
ncbi:hypothetical protein PFISCL1PPCAC_12472, partial [Pristionchus fissidentatus]